MGVEASDQMLEVVGVTDVCAVNGCILLCLDTGRTSGRGVDAEQIGIGLFENI